jgi:uracil-DNA glycosylase family 4
MTWTERQRAMLRAMGLAVWSPPAAEAAVDVAGQEAVASEPPTRPAPAAATPTDPSQPVAQAITRIAAAVPEGAATFEVEGVASMDWPALRAAVAACRACALCESRTQTVFGVGHPQASLMVVGEAPGEQEDLKGESFVGPAGQLLDAMLRAIGHSRQEGAPQRPVYIANTLKCRPPRNRNPEPAELAKCEPFLRRQLALVQPRVILAMGRFAVQQLLRSDEAIGRLRGRVHTYEGVPLVVTYHPAYLLRQPADKAKAWEDLCLAASLLPAG